jgi:hypothetical protein
MKRISLSLNLALPAILVLVGVYHLHSPAPVSAAAPGRPGLAGKWDRLNPDQGNLTPEHEVLRCGDNAQPMCVYDKQPEPKLGFQNPPDSTNGHFRGQDVTATWECPPFLSEAFENVLFVVHGVMDFDRSDGSELIVDQELIVADVAGEARLYVYWVDQQFACPWYRSFDQALAANPFPTPFNGEEWPTVDCIFP